MAEKIKVGDKVKVLAGADRGKVGDVTQVDRSSGWAWVEGVNVRKRHVRPGARSTMPDGGIVEEPGKVHLSNLQFYSEELGKSVRVGFQLAEDGSKQRIARGQGNDAAVLD